MFSLDVALRARRPELGGVEDLGELGLGDRLSEAEGAEGRFGVRDSSLRFKCSPEIRNSSGYVSDD